MSYTTRHFLAALQSILSETAKNQNSSWRPSCYTSTPCALPFVDKAMHALPKGYNTRLEITANFLTCAAYLRNQTGLR